MKPWMRAAAHLAALLPLAWLLARGLLWGLGANPIEAAIRYLGDWALQLLLISLAITPVRLATGWGWIGPLRRLAGLYGFAYAALHLLLYLVIDQGLDWADIWTDVSKHKFITAGVAAFLLLLPLAATSTNKALRRLGAARWQALHRLVFPATALATLHYFWMVKRDITWPVAFGVVFTGLLAARAVAWRRSRLATTPTSYK